VASASHPGYAAERDQVLGYWQAHRLGLDQVAEPSLG
jgi:hypothetical protein